MVNNSNWWSRVIHNPLFNPIVVYIASFILPALVMGLPAVILNWSVDYQNAHLYILGTAGQFMMDLPAVILFGRLRPIPEAETAVAHKGRDRVVSAIVGLVCALVMAALRLGVMGRLMGGRFMGGVPAFTQAWDLGSPWNLIAAPLALLAYGPGEALFVVYLVLAFDRALGHTSSWLSKGVILASVLWALPHFFNVIFFGVSAIPNVVIMFFIGLIVGVLLKATRSAVGPMLFWTLVNGTSA